MWRTRRPCSVEVPTLPWGRIVLHHRADHFTGNSGVWWRLVGFPRSEEHTSELQSLMRISYAVVCFNKKNQQHPRPEITLAVFSYPHVRSFIRSDAFNLLITALGPLTIFF